MTGISGIGSLGSIGSVGISPTPVSLTPSTTSIASDVPSTVVSFGGAVSPKISS